MRSRFAGRAIQGIFRTNPSRPSHGISVRREHAEIHKAHRDGDQKGKSNSKFYGRATVTIANLLGSQVSSSGSARFVSHYLTPQGRQFLP
jgi:hypothetical protein